MFLLVETACGEGWVGRNVDYLEVGSFEEVGQFPPKKYVRVTGRAERRRVALDNMEQTELVLWWCLNLRFFGPSSNPVDHALRTRLGYALHLSETTT